MTAEVRRSVVITARARFLMSERRAYRFRRFEGTVLPYQSVRPLRDALLWARLGDLADAQRLRCVTVVEHCGHEALALVAAGSFPAAVLIAALDHVIAVWGKPTPLSLDSGTEFRSAACNAWASDRGIQLHLIQPGTPVPNAHIEHFNA